ncbi:MAG TPA: D-aminoacyl-tRNA deacylase [Gemmatimonadaceae bacterium]|jgi:D-tyrosyl-tRNA(Tyr) deacylase
MRVVLQRVSRASVTVGGGVIGEIGAGLLLLVAFAHGDTAAETEWMADKVAGLRVFGDADGKMNRSVSEISGSVLVVSQFTLYGDSRKGRRPSFVDAARPEIAVPLYDAFITFLRASGIQVATGEFGADMKVELVNDGPVTLVLDRVPRAPGAPSSVG